MELSSELISQFARITNDEPTINEGSTVYATYRLQGESAYVQIDGSDTITPVATTAGAKSGDRVTVLIKDHKAIVTGNLTDPSANKSTVEEMSKDLGLGGRLEQVYNIVDPVNWTYTDESGNIQTLTGKLGDMTSQVTGMAASIEDAEKVATNFIEFVNPYGLIIGDLTGSTLGFNTLIDATSLNMRYNDTVLAKYTADSIYLGYSSRQSIINMCNGLATMGPDANYINRLRIKSDSGMVLESTDGPIHLSSKRSLLNLDTDGIYILSNYTTDPMGGDDSSNVGFFLDNYSRTIEVYGTLSGYSPIGHTHSGYAASSHTHSQYYESGDNIYANKLYVQGAGNISGDPNARLAVNSPNQLGYASGSSRKFKHDIKPIENEELDPEHLYDIEVVQFKYNDDYLEENDQRYGIDCIGFIAEQVNEVYPIAADRETGEPRNWEMRYIIPPMLALIQQQKKKIDDLESRMNELEGREVV